MEPFGIHFYKSLQKILLYLDSITNFFKIILFSKCPIAVIECVFLSIVWIKLPSSALSKFKSLCFYLSNYTET